MIVRLSLEHHSLLLLALLLTLESISYQLLLDFQSSGVHLLRRVTKCLPLMFLLRFMLLFVVHIRSEQWNSKSRGVGLVKCSLVVIDGWVQAIEEGHSFLDCLGSLNLNSSLHPSLHLRNLLSLSKLSKLLSSGESDVRAKILRTVRCSTIWKLTSTVGLHSHQILPLSLLLQIPKTQGI